MRAILINPHKQEIREVAEDWKQFRLIGEYLAQGARGPLRAPLCAGPRLNADVHTYVDDEGYFRPGQAWCELDGYQCPLAGYVLVLGANGPDEAALPAYVTVRRLESIIRWITPERAQAMAPPTRIYSGGELIEEIVPDFADIRPLTEAIRV